MLRTCHAHVGGMLGTSCGHNVDMLGPCWGHVWNMLGTYLEHVWDFAYIVHYVTHVEGAWPCCWGEGGAAGLEFQ